MLYKLYSFTSDVHIALYPNTKKLLLLNDSNKVKNAEFSINFDTILEQNNSKKYYLREIVENKELFGTGQNTIKFKIEMPPHAIRCFEIMVK